MSADTWSRQGYGHMVRHKTYNTQNYCFLPKNSKKNSKNFSSARPLSSVEKLFESCMTRKAGDLCSGMPAFRKIPYVRCLEGADPADLHVASGNLRHESLEHFARADLDEVSCSVCEHVLHALCPSDRRCELGQKICLYLFRVN